MTITARSTNKICLLNEAKIALNDTEAISNDRNYAPFCKYSLTYKNIMSSSPSADVKVGGVVLDPVGRSSPQQII